MSNEWHAAPLVLAAVVVAAVLFTQAFVRLRRRGRKDHAGWDRAALFAGGLALLALPLVSPLDAAADRLLSAHMLQHVLIGDAGPVLLVLAVRGPLALFLLPPAVLRPVASSAAIRAGLRVLMRPVVALTVWGAVVLGWHVPAAYDYALSHPFVHDLEHATFIAAGTLAWMQLVDPGRRARLTRGGRIAFAFGMLVIGQPVMDALLFTPRALYHPYAVQSDRLLGLGVLTDQRLAGVIMLVEQLLTLGTFIAVLLIPMLLVRRTTRAAAAQRPA